MITQILFLGQCILWNFSLCIISLYSVTSAPWVQISSSGSYLQKPLADIPLST
jgi:hypothetical protein